MNAGGEAADQIVRMSLNGVEVAVKLAGEGAKNIAALLFTILSSREQTSGKARLSSMLKSGKELTVFSVQNDNLKQFIQEAKHYGVLYCALKDPNGSPDGMTDIMVRSEDAAKINRIVERFKFAAVDTAKVQAEIEQARSTPDAAEKDAEQVNDLVDAMMTPLQEAPVERPEGADMFAVPLQSNVQQVEEGEPENPTLAGRNESGNPSEASSPSLEEHREIERGEKYRPSVREQLKGIEEAQRVEQQVKEPAKSRWNGEQTLLSLQNKAKHLKRTER